MVNIVLSHLNAVVNTVVSTPCIATLTIVFDSHFVFDSHY